MKSTILVLGFALVSVFAVAQSSGKADAAKKSSDTKQAPAATQPAAKVTPEKMEAGSESIKKTVEIPPTKAKPEAADDWQTKQAATTSSNGNVTTNAATPSSNEVKSPRDIATGQASGKRQHQPITMTKEAEQKLPSEKK